MKQSHKKILQGRTIKNRLRYFIRRLKHLIPFILKRLRSFVFHYSKYGRCKRCGSKKMWFSRSEHYPCYSMDYICEECGTGSHCLTKWGFHRKCDTCPYNKEAN